MWPSTGCIAYVLFCFCCQVLTYKTQHHLSQLTTLGAGESSESDYTYYDAHAPWVVVKFLRLLQLCVYNLGACLSLLVHAHSTPQTK
jgi:hypothetical protein